VARELLHVASDTELSAGRHELRFEFEPTGQPDPTKGHGSPGRLQLYIDGKLAGNRDVPYTTLFLFNPGALTCGADPGSTVTDDYETPFRFSGTMHTVTVDLGGELITDPEAELAFHMARQ
jgi:arylsulfatase